MQRSSRRLLSALLVGCCLVTARADVPRRHVHVPGLGDGDVELIVTDLGGDPVGVVAGGDVVSRPPGGGRRDDETLLAADSAGNAGQAAPEVRPDRLTSTTTATDYYEAFTPAVAPYKRVASYDAVRVDPDGTPVLFVADTELSAVSIVGTRPREQDVNDAFWGTVMLDFRNGRRVPIPSVAPHARILHVRTEPEADLVISRDSAGNYFVESLEPGAGILRLTFLTDAPRRFFRQPAPSDRTNALVANVPPVPESVRARAREFAAELGVGPDAPLERTLDALVAHFRAFVESDAMPAQTADAYLDLARGGVGVCRHRAYAFVVTALGLGIPAHYVQNEAHAWVEVELPRTGWVRIDLGGSATAIDAHGLQDRPRHEVSGADPFPQPEVFVRDYLERGVAPLETPAPSASASAEAAGIEGSESDGSAETTPQDGREARATNPRATEHAGEAGAEAGQDEATSPSDSPPRRASTTALTTESLRVYRGQMLDLAGEVRDEDGSPIEGGRVEVRVGPARLLAIARTDAEGRFVLTLGIPPDLGIGSHPLTVAFVGDAHHQASRAP